MKNATLFLTITSLAFAGRLGIGIAGGTEYNREYQSMTMDDLHNMCHGGEFYLQAEALPCILLESSVSYLNDPELQSTSAGLGVGVDVQPRLGGFPVVPRFSVEGIVLFYNDMDIAKAVRNGQLYEYVESSHPKLIGSGSAGISIFFGKSVSLDCTYRYHSFAPQYGLEMVYAGLCYYLNW